MKQYTLKEAESILKLKRRTLYKYIETGQLDAPIIKNKHVVTEAAIREFLDLTPGEPLKVYTLEELEPITQLKRRTLYEHIRNGKLKAVKHGCNIFVSEKNVNEFMATRENGI